MTDIPTPAVMALLLSGALLLWFVWGRITCLLMFFQQEEYDSPRFLRWIVLERGFDRQFSLVCLIAALSAALAQMEGLSAVGMAALPLIWLACFMGARRSKALQTDSKKPLNLTERAKRIRQVAFAVAVLDLIAIGWLVSLAPEGQKLTLDLTFSNPSFAVTETDWRLSIFASLLILFAQALPIALVVAVMLLAPIEERIKTGFRDEAKEKLTRIKPRIIAITGSFGKTSTKHILHHILSTAAPTLMTPGSVNTDMGITRVIREQLEDSHTYFIVEMGAYGPGSIARLCGLTPPDVSLVTAVGHAHYERFKTLDAVARTKFEIAEAAFARGGQTIVAVDGIPSDLLEDRLKVVQGDYIKVGRSSDHKISDIQALKDGTHFTLLDPVEGPQALFVPLFGEHTANNTAVAAATARAAGLPWSVIRAALKTMPQIKHRLEVVRTPGGPTILDDAYNSNPIGFKSALGALDLLVEEGGRRIVVTPGMVELGVEHDSAHSELGQIALKHTDVVAVVTPERIPTFVEALEAGIAAGSPLRLLKFATQADAQAWVESEWRAGDAVLFENNLPDLYEATVRF